MRLRNKLFAHSDSDEFRVTPFRGDAGLWNMTLIASPPEMLVRAELLLLSRMLKKLQKGVRKEQERLHKQLGRLLPENFLEELSEETIFKEFSRARMRE